MKVQTNFRLAADLVDVWIYRETFKGWMQSVMVGEDRWEWREQEPTGANAPAPSLTLPGDVYAAMVSQGAGILPPSEATERHLRDALKVRDRLLDQVVPAK